MRDDNITGENRLSTITYQNKRNLSLIIYNLTVFNSPILNFLSETLSIIRENFDNQKCFDFVQIMGAYVNRRSRSLIGYNAV